MNVKRYLAFCISLSAIAVSLVTTLPANAQAQDHGKHVAGSVWASKRYSQRNCVAGQICPQVSQGLPGGGDAYINSGLQWYPLTIDGIGQTGIQSTIYTWNLSSTSDMYVNHVFSASDGPRTKWSSGQNDSIQSEVQNGYPWGNLWSNQAYGTVSNSLTSWSDNVIVRQQL